MKDINYVGAYYHQGRRNENLLAFFSSLQKFRRPKRSNRPTYFANKLWQVGLSYFGFPDHQCQLWSFFLDVQKFVRFQAKINIFLVKYLMLKNNFHEKDIISGTLTCQIIVWDHLIVQVADLSKINKCAGPNKAVQEGFFSFMQMKIRF